MTTVLSTSAAGSTELLTSSHVELLSHLTESVTESVTTNNPGRSNPLAARSSPNALSGGHAMISRFVITRKL